jgi:hypothetical protein
MQKSPTAPHSSPLVFAPGTVFEAIAHRIGFKPSKAIEFAP